MNTHIDNHTVGITTIDHSSTIINISVIHHYGNLHNHDLNLKRQEENVILFDFIYNNNLFLEKDNVKIKTKGKKCYCCGISSSSFFVLNIHFCITPVIIA